MSKRFKSIVLGAAVFLLILQTFNICRAQSIEAVVEIEPIKREASVAARFTGTRPQAVTFPTSRAGANDLQKRLSRLAVSGVDGGGSEPRTIAPGAYASNEQISVMWYTVDLKPREPVTSAAHVSWLDGDAGMLALGDLLPDSGFGRSAKVFIRLPDGWTAYAPLAKLSDGRFETDDFDRAVVVIGRGIRQTEINAGGAKLSLVMQGSWQVPDATAAAMAKQVFEGYAADFGTPPSAGAFQIFLGRFPGEVGPGRWEAETRGASVAILSSEMAFATQSEQRLHEQLRHEIFHLWVPNGVRLSGGYDWFYEGFALYASLKSATLAGRIRFGDFLDTLTRAHAIDAATRRKKPLPEASSARWEGGNTQVYARGMLVAFLADVAMLRDSNGREDIATLLRAVFEKHRPPAAPVEGNAAVLNEFLRSPALKALADSYVNGTADIAWQTELDAAGIETDSSGKLIVKAKLNRRQKDLLDELGYNAWRKKTQSPR